MRSTPRLRNVIDARPGIAAFAAVACAAVLSGAYSLRPGCAIAERALAAILGFVAVYLALYRRDAMAREARRFGGGLRHAAGPLAMTVASGALIAAVTFPLGADGAEQDAPPTPHRLSRYGDALLNAARFNDERLPPMRDRVTLRFWVQDRPGFTPSDTLSRENGVPFFVNRRLSNRPLRPAARASAPLTWTEPVGPAGGRWVFFATGEVREVGRGEWDRVRPRD